MTRLTPARLRRDIAAFLAFKRSLGYPYRRGEATLQCFARFADRYRAAQPRIDLPAAIRAWLLRAPGRKPVTLATDLGAVRQFCRYRRRHDPTGYVPPTRLAPHTESHFTPYVFSTDEIRRLVAAAGQHSGRNFWPAMLRMLIVVTYCTGLRLGEAVRLQCADLDMRQQTLWIRTSKGRSRTVPFQADLAREFEHYLAARVEVLRTADRECSTLFVGRNGRAIRLASASLVICRLLRRLGLKPARGRSGPRPYDLRHAFAVHRLTAWYRDGVDLQARLPWLSAYMGHVNVLGTEVYLHATADLLQIASQRFDRRFSQSGEPP